MRKQDVRRKEDAGDRVFLIRIQLDLRRQIRECEERAVEAAPPDAAEFFVENILQTLSSLRIGPHPAFKQLLLILLLFQRQQRFRLVKYVLRFARIVRV